MNYNDSSTTRTTWVETARPTNGGGPSLPYGDDLDNAEELIVQVEGDTLRAVGDIDLYQATYFRQRAEEHILSVASPRLDLTRVPFLDSAGLAALLSLSRTAKAKGKSLRLAIVGSPRRVLRITGIDQMLQIEE